MDGQNETAAADSPVAPATQKRERSAIAFPYNDLSDAIEVAHAIHDNVGLGGCDDDQLAAWLKQSAKSSGFRVQVSAARMFGLLESSAPDHRLAELGRRIVDPAQTRAARAQAFLNVPLYSAVFEKYKGGVLPPAAALERDMVGLGVAQKQKDRARQVFERAAEQGGFFEHGKDRLIRPGVALRDEPPPEDRGRQNGGEGGGGDGGDGEAIDPIIAGLLKRLPKSGEIWPEPQRDLWLELLKGSFKLIYRDSPEPGPSAPGEGPKPW